MAPPKTVNATQRFEFKASPAFFKKLDRLAELLEGATSTSESKLGSQVSAAEPLEKMERLGALIDNKLSRKKMVAAQEQFNGKKERSSFIEQDRK